MIESLPLGCLTLSAVGLAAGMIYLRRDNLWSLHNLFWAAWLYYGFSVGIDLITGARLPEIRGELDLSSELAMPLLMRLMGLYFLCGAAFAATYHWGRRADSGIQDCQFDVRIPSTTILLAIHLFIAYFYVSQFFGIDRMTREMLSRDLIAVKLRGLSIPLLLAIDLVILMSAERHQSRIPLAMGISLAVLTGNRVYIAVLTVSALLRYRPRLASFRTLALAVLGIAGLFTFKFVYGLVQATWRGEPVSLDAAASQWSLSLSALDAYASSVIGAFYLQSPSPHWNGWSYVVIPWQLTWPRFLGGYDVSTLAETYVWNFHPGMAQSGGGLAFSAMAEAWLNFGLMGAVILGVVWGALIRWCDGRARGPLFYLVAILTVRLFRSDFASLYKSWMLVWGAMYFLAVSALIAYSLLSRPEPCEPARSLSRA